MALPWAALFCALAAAAAPVRTVAPSDAAAVLARVEALGPLARADAAPLAEAAAELEALRLLAPALPDDVREAVLDRAREAREETQRRRLASYEERVRAAGWERGDWEEVARLADEAAPPAPARDFVEDHLADRAAEERGRRAAAARRWRARAAASSDPLRELKALVGRRLPREDAARLAALEPYVPGMAPRSTFGPHWALELSGPVFGAAGWAAHVDGGAPGKARPVALAVNLRGERDYDWHKTAVHEALHQSDPGYRRGEAALRLLLGSERGEALFTALIEGYTELRTWRVLRRLLAEGEAGATGAPAAFREAFSQDWIARAFIHGVGQAPDERLARRLEASWDSLLEKWLPLPYAPWARMAEELALRPGGEEALDAFVKRGDPGPLVGVAGRERLEAAADVADARAELAGRTWRPGRRKRPHVRGVETMGLLTWLDGKTGDALAGRLDAAQAARARAAARAVLAELQRLGRADKKPKGWVEYRAMRLVDLERYVGLPLAQLRALVREDYARARLRLNQLYNEAW